MSDRLPPLTALRAFDAAARHLSFARAAEELGVTPAALSFQIKSLEAHLGAPLFHRLNRAVELTEAGAALAPEAREGFETLARGWQAARRGLESDTLVVTAGPAITAKWLAPRLYEFAHRHPEIDLRFSASLKIMDFERDGIDVAIRFGRGPDPGLYAVRMAREWLSPVMTPALAARYPTPESLCEAPLIFDTSLDLLGEPCDWPVWFRAVGVDFTPARPAARFSQADHAVDAALAGAGVVLGRRAIVVTDIAAGRLVAPYGVAITTEAHFRFLCPAGHETRPRIAAFRDWILSEVEKTAFVSRDLTLIPAKDLADGSTTGDRA